MVAARNMVSDMLSVWMIAQETRDGRYHVVKMRRWRPPSETEQLMNVVNLSVKLHTVYFVKGIRYHDLFILHLHTKDQILCN